MFVCFAPYDEPEIAVAIAIMINLYRMFTSIGVEKLKNMKW